MRAAALLLAATLAAPASAGDGALTFRAGSDVLVVPTAAVRGFQALDNSGQPVIAITMADGLALAFSRLTVAHVGEVMDLLVCGAVVSSPVIQAPIYGNELRITGTFTVDQAADLARRISTDDCAGFVSPS
jgi:hypothetical protein